MHRLFWLGHLRFERHPTSELRGHRPRLRDGLANDDAQVERFPKPLCRVIDPRSGTATTRGCDTVVFDGDINFSNLTTAFSSDPLAEVSGTLTTLETVPFRDKSPAPGILATLGASSSLRLLANSSATTPFTRRYMIPFDGLAPPFELSAGVDRNRPFGFRGQPGSATTWRAGSTPTTADVLGNPAPSG